MRLLPYYRGYLTYRQESGELYMAVVREFMPCGYLLVAVQTPSQCSGGSSSRVWTRSRYEPKSSVQFRVIA
jgi:hypothetical protein